MSEEKYLDYLDAIEKHVEKHIGPIEQVFHELIPSEIHIDILWCPPNETRPYHTLVTSGMSYQKMNVPEGRENFEFGELVLSLPSSWQLTEDAFREEENYWPIRWMKTIARFPFENNTWLTFGHVLANGSPAVPFHPTTKFVEWMIDVPILFPAQFEKLAISEGKIINFYSLTALYPEEMRFELENGPAALNDKLKEANIAAGTLVINRKNSITQN